MNIQQLRQSLREKWIEYYRENREWLVKFGVWVDCDGVRRPTSSFILATISVLEPRLTRLMPLVVELSSSPDRVIVALGLNFSPDKVLEEERKVQAETAAVRLLPSSHAPVMTAASTAVEETLAGSIHQATSTEKAVPMDLAEQDAIAHFNGVAMSTNATESGGEGGNTSVAVDEAIALGENRDPDDLTLDDPALAASSTTIRDLDDGSGNDREASTMAEQLYPDPDGDKSMAPLSTNFSENPDKRVSYQDEKCNGRQPHDDDEIWR